MKKIIFILSTFSILFAYLPILAEDVKTSDVQEEITTTDKDATTLKERKTKEKNKERKKKKSEENKEDDEDIIMYLD